MIVFLGHTLSLLLLTPLPNLFLLRTLMNVARVSAHSNYSESFNFHLVWVWISLK